jgi:penicillin amidase
MTRNKYRRYLFPLSLHGAAAAALLTLLISCNFHHSLPPLEGTFPAEVTEPVTIERDAQGILSISGSNRFDVAFGLGFVHGQDRFFQMDLLRRFAAGELSALLGSATVAVDREQRLHRFRARAKEWLEELPERERQLLAAYTSGVEAGRATLARQPWEYTLLQAEVQPWQAEDCLLVVLGMFLQLQNNQAPMESARLLLQDTLPPALAEFLTPLGSSWDAPLLGDPLPLPPLPTAEQCQPLRRVVGWQEAPGPADEWPTPGSNNWAVAGKRSRHGGAMVACDMHLATRVPNIWYRAVMRWGDRRLVGATLPGAPALIVGSTGRIAWGFTNAEVDTVDLVVSDEPGTMHSETIAVRGGPAVEMTVEETSQGPVFDRDHQGRRRVLRWTAHRREAVNLRLMELEEVHTVDEAIALASHIGIPTQNFVVADHQGAIGWALMGRLPRRVGERWDGWIDEGPRLINPEEGIVWTANNRTFGEPWLSQLGRGTFDNGARAMQIRDGLRSRPQMDEADLLALQLDDRAVFLSRWRELFLQEAAKQPFAVPQNLIDAVQHWGGRASPDSIGYRLVKEFRGQVRQQLLAWLCVPAVQADRRFTLRHLDRNVEGSIWEITTQRPDYLLPPRYNDWDAFFVDVFNQTQIGMRDPENHTQGAATAPRIRHPLSPGLGPISPWMHLDMEQRPLPGDEFGMPRIQGPIHMASQRMGVSPGREEQGYFHMPTGQSGHFLSPFYRAGHADWADGRPSPLLPGPTQYTITLRPQ